MLILNIARKVKKTYREYRLSSLPITESWQKIDNKFWMKIMPDDFMDRGFYLGSYEPLLKYFINNFVQRDEICIDIGAHKGYFTLQLAKAVGDNGKVIAIDADDNVIIKLNENCAKNKYKNISIYNIALGDVEELSEFSFSNQTGYSSRFPNLIAKPKIRSVSTIKISTLDQLINDLGLLQDKQNLSFIKIDAEGSESRILKGMSNTITKFKPILWIEVNNESLISAETSPKSIQDTLNEHEYDIFRINCKRDHLFRSKLSLKKTNNLQSDIKYCEDIVAVSNNSDYFDRFAKIFLKDNSYY